MNQTTILSSSLHNWFSNTLPEFKEIHSISPLSGGDINDVYKVSTNCGMYVVKVNDPQKFPGMFEAESKGLKMLASTGIHTPYVMGFEENSDFTFLVMRFITKGSSSLSFWKTFGEDLAKMHQHSSSHFGLSYSNYMGSLVQQNAEKDNWAEFFVTQRLEPQLKLAYDSGFLKSSSSGFSRLMHRLDNIVPCEKPALVHGDLWGGNFIPSTDGKSVLIDPAAHYGHREADIAMMHLFGGFDNSLFQRYTDVFPLEKGWKERIDIHNLYPLLVHVNLFGSAYTGQVASIVRRFTN